MKPQRFVFRGVTGVLFSDGWVHFGHCGFHRTDIVGPLREFLDQIA